MADELSYEAVVGNRTAAPQGPAPAPIGGAKEITWEQLKGQSQPQAPPPPPVSKTPSTDQAIQGGQGLWGKLFGGARLASNEEYRKQLAGEITIPKTGAEAWEWSGQPIGGALPRYNAKPGDPWWKSTLGGYYNAGAGLSDFVTSPRGLAELGVTALFPPAGIAFLGAEVAPSLPEQIPQIYKAATGQLPPAESAEAGAGLAAILAGGAHPIARRIAPGPTNLPLPPLLRPSTAASYPVLPFETRKSPGAAPTGRFTPGDFEATGPVEMQKEGAQPINVEAMAKEDASRKLANLHAEIEELTKAGKPVPETMLKDANMLADIIEGRPPVQEEVNTHASSEPGTTGIPSSDKGGGVDEEAPLRQPGQTTTTQPSGTEPISTTETVATEPQKATPQQITGWQRRKAAVQAELDLLGKLEQTDVIKGHIEDRNKEIEHLDKQIAGELPPDALPPLPKSSESVAEGRIETMSATEEDKARRERELKEAEGEAPTRFVVEDNAPGFHDVVDTGQKGNPVISTHPDRSTAEKFAAQYEKEAPKPVKPSTKGPIQQGMEAAQEKARRAKVVAGIAQKPLQAMPLSFTRLLSPQDQADHKALQQAWTSLDFEFGDAVRHGDDDTAWEIASMQGELKKRMRSIEKQLPDADVYDVLTVGGGPTGATAAIYSGAEGNKTGVLDLDTPGGASKRTPLYENVPGKLGQTGRERALVGQLSATRHGAEYHRITEITAPPTYDPETRLWTVKAQMGKLDKTFRTRTLIASSGTRGGGAPFEVWDSSGKAVTRSIPRGPESAAEARGKLPITGTAQDKSGVKVHLNDGSSMAVEALSIRHKNGGKGGDMVGAGGANSAGQGAVDAAVALMRLYLPKGTSRGLTGQRLLEYVTNRMIPRPADAPQFHLIIRGPGPEMSGYLADKVNMLHDLGWIEYHGGRQIHHIEAPDLANGNRKVAVLQTSDTRDAQGHTIHGKLTGERISADSVGSFIGGRPVTEWLPKDVGIDARTGGVITKENTMQVLNKNGEVIPGLYAAGTVRHAATGRVAPAEGEGGTAVDHVGQYLTHDIEHGDYYPQWKMDLRSNFNRMEAEKKAHGVVSRQDVEEIHPSVAPPEQPTEKLPEPNPITFTTSTRRGKKVTLPGGREVYLSPEGAPPITGGKVKPEPRPLGPVNKLPPPPSPPTPIGPNQQQQQQEGGEVGIPVVQHPPGKIARFKNYTDQQLHQELQERKNLKPYTDSEIGGELARRANLTGGGAPPPVSPLREMINAKAMGDFNKAYKLAQEYKEDALTRRKRMIDDWQKDVGPKTYSQEQADQAIAKIEAQPLVPQEVEQLLRDRAAYLEKQGIGIKTPDRDQLEGHVVTPPKTARDIPLVVDPETRMEELTTFSDEGLKGSLKNGDITKEEYDEAMMWKARAKANDEKVGFTAKQQADFNRTLNLMKPTKEDIEAQRVRDAAKFFRERAGKPQAFSVPDLLNEMNKGIPFPGRDLNPPDIEGEFTKIEPRLALPDRAPLEFEKSPLGDVRAVVESPDKRTKLYFKFEPVATEPGAYRIDFSNIGPTRDPKTAFPIFRQQLPYAVDQFRKQFHPKTLYTLAANDSRYKLYRRLLEKSGMDFEPIEVLNQKGFKINLDPEAREIPPTITHSQDHPISEVPLKDIALSKDVPQFKSGANEQGIVEPLAGKYERVGTPPVQLWKRNSGKLELISGRHRFDLAKRTGEKTIPSQIHHEANGFDARQAARLDAELNIRDNQGSVADYANYFKNSGITQEAAESRGLLARGTGKAGFSIARNGSESVFALHQSGKITDAQAQAIGEAAPGNEGLQRVGVKAALDGESGQSVGNLIKGVRARMGDHPEGKQLDLLSSDDTAMKTMVAAGKRASALQREINQLISSVAGAARHPEKARALGVNVDDPGGVAKKLAELRSLADRAKHWDMDPEMRDMILKGDMTPEQMIKKLSPTTNAAPEPVETKETEPRRPPIGWDESISQGKEWLAAGGDIKDVIQDFHKTGKVTTLDMGKARAHLNDLRAATNQIGDELLKHPKDAKLQARLDDAMKAEESFNNSYRPMEAVAHDTLKVLDGYAPMDEASATSYTGLMRRFHELRDRPSMLVEENKAKQIADKAKKTDLEYKKATAETYNAMDREFDRIKTDRVGEPTIETATKAIAKNREVCG